MTFLSLATRTQLKVLTLVASKAIKPPKIVIIGGSQRLLLLQHHRSFATFNINNAIKKSEEGQYFQELIKQPVTTLQGIGPKHGEELETLGLKTIQQLADYKFFHLAKSLTVLAKTEETDGRINDSVMNINKGIDKEFQELPLTELIQQPIHALKGISPDGGKIFQSLGVKTVSDLAAFKYCLWAEAIATAARFEETE